MQLWALQFAYFVPQRCATCSLCLWAAGCRRKVSQSASSGRGVHLCGFAAPRGDPDRTHPALLVEDALCSSLLRTTKRKVTAAVPTATYRRLKPGIPFCLALLMISMCFMETFRSFLVMSEATSTFRETERNKIKYNNKNNNNVRICYLLNSADQDSGEEA